jgi:dUTP pyrophosphatase
MKVKVINRSANELPQYETPDSVGMDVRAELMGIKEKFLFNAEVLRETTATVDNGEIPVVTGICIHPGGRALIPTGIYTAFDRTLEVQVRSRSGLALKNGVFVLNSPGTIEGDYRAEYGVILMNMGNEDFIVRQGDRIAQLVLNRVERIEWETVDSLDETERKGGFGSTGTK